MQVRKASVAGERVRPDFQASLVTTTAIEADLGAVVADVQVGGVEIDAGDTMSSTRRVRNVPTTSSRAGAAARHVGLLDPRVGPQCPHQSSTERVDMPLT
jgi:hypothetical protein